MDVDKLASTINSKVIKLLKERKNLFQDYTDDAFSILSSENKETTVRLQIHIYDK